MIVKARLVASVLACAVPIAGCASSQSENVVEPWQETPVPEEGAGTTSAKIDFDAVNKAYQSASSPEDFEQKVNEIYTGDEIISVAVQDQDSQTQLVTGFIDKNQNGVV